MRKIQIVFGSTSDESIYQAAASAFTQRDFLTDVKVISAHRNPQELKQLLQDLSPQAIVAGAGLAAHLPGVTASLSSYPVFGIPVSSQFLGLDAFLSIVQMPKGVPVVCSFQAGEIADFLNAKDFSEKIHSTCTNDGNSSLQEANILVASLKEHQDLNFSGLRVLWLSEQEKQNPEVCLQWLSLAKNKGLWLGANRLDNAKIFLQKIRGIYDN